MDFLQNKFEIKKVVTKEFFNSVKDLNYGGYAIHHSHVIGEIIGYAHDFFNNETYSATFNSLPNNDKNWILDYLCGGKGVIEPGQNCSRRSLKCLNFFANQDFHC